MKVATMGLVPMAPAPMGPEPATEAVPAPFGTRFPAPIVLPLLVNRTVPAGSGWPGRPLMVNVSRRVGEIALTTAVSTGFVFAEREAAVGLTTCSMGTSVAVAGV